MGTLAALMLPRAALAEADLEEPTLPAELHAGEQAPAIEALWIEGVAYEHREDLLESSRLYEAIAGMLPESAFIRWRISRNYWRCAERLPPDDKSARIHYFQLADEWATRALELDPNCGECILWKLASMGRLATTSGVIEAMHLASTIADMIDRGIALKPAHRDGRSNVTLANLYYAGAAFYRIVPDHFWAQWTIGVRGDKQRSLEYIRKAVAISEPRVDYQVELGAVLLCIGQERRDPERIEEGRRALQVAMALPYFQRTDPIDIEHARALMADPRRACSYSRDGWVEAGASRQSWTTANGGSQGLR
ncbi:MAG TPA: hypothetical protein VIY27_14985 [Myxococcota bacterium]